MSRRQLTLATVATVALALAGAAFFGFRGTKPAAPGNPQGTPATAGPAGSQAARAAPAVKPPLEIPSAEIITVRQAPLTQVQPMSGTIRATQTAVVKAKVAAELTRLSVREGDSVKAGQAIGEQDATEFDWRIRQADQQAQAARSQWEVAQRTLANNRALVAQGFISPTALETSASNEAASQATLQAALAALELARKSRSDARLSAPIPGVVSQRFAQPGERLGVDARVVEIVDLSRLELEAALAPQEAARVRVGQRARVRAEGLSDTVGARVARISPSAQPGSRTVAVYLTLDPHPALRHGLFAQGEILLQEQPALLVPASAVHLDRSKPYVWLLDGDTVRERTVVLGPRGQSPGLPDAQALDSGVSDGARLLSGTLGTLTDGVRWKPAP
jgi:membrane fusion protein (multidrug efflux system)